MSLITLVNRLTSRMDPYPYLKATNPGAADVTVINPNGSPIPVNIVSGGGSGGGGGTAAVDLLYTDNSGQIFMYRDNGATPPVLTAYTVPGGAPYVVGANPVPYEVNNGTDGTGIVQPAGGVGIRGWLSGIYQKLSGTMAVSAAALPLPAGAATALNQTAGTTAVVAAINASSLTPGAALISSATGPGIGGAGIPRMTVSSDSTVGISALPASVILTSPAPQSVVSTDMLTGNPTTAASSWTDVSLYRSMSLQLIGGAGITAGNVTVEQTNDSTNALVGQPAIVFSASGSSGGAFSGSALTVSAGSVATFNVAITTRYVRVRINSAFVGGTATAVAVLNQHPFSPLIGTAIVAGTTSEGSSPTTAPILDGGKVQTTVQAAIANGMAAIKRLTSSGTTLVTPYAPPEVSWSFAAPVGGIVNTTTAETIAPAVVGVHNCVSTLQLMSDLLTTATEFVINDGHGGVALFRHKIDTAGIPGGINFTFLPPLQSTAGNLLEVATLTASGGGSVYANAQGFQR